MTEHLQNLATRLENRFKGSVEKVELTFGEVAVTVPPAKLLEVMQALRDEGDFAFQELIDLCGVDYLYFGITEWATEEASTQGFSRGVHKATSARFSFVDAPPKVGHDGPRFAVAYQLLSLKHNQRLRVKVFAADDEFPVVDSVVNIWSCANWFEREAFDLYGIVFDGHPDMRRILTDYGFVGHPFRKDFPLIGHVEMRYDPEQARVVYEPVSIDPRVLVPKVIRHDHRYEGVVSEEEGGSNA